MSSVATKRKRAVKPVVKRVKYTPKVGSRVNKKQAMFIGQYAEKHGGEITPEELIKISRPENSVTHSLFDWDLQKAAKAHWLAQARTHLSSIEVTVIIDKVPTKTKCFHAVFTPTHPKKRQYVLSKVVAKTVSYRQQVIDNALAEIRGWTRKYEEYMDVLKPEVFRLLQGEDEEEE